MTDTAAALEEKLKSIIDTETEKDPQKMNCRLIGICTDGILRLYNTESLIIPGKKYENSVNDIVNGKKIKLSKTAKIILIAAAIIALLAATAIGYGQLKYDIFDFGDHSLLSTQKVQGTLEEELSVGYIPEDFILTEEQRNKFQHTLIYANGERNFYISKESFFENILIDSENGKPREKDINGISFLITGNDDEWCTVRWFTTKYYFSVAGNLTETELLKIAETVS